MYLIGFYNLQDTSIECSVFLTLNYSHFKTVSLQHCWLTNYQNQSVIQTKTYYREDLDLKNFKFPAQCDNTFRNSLTLKFLYIVYINHYISNSFSQVSQCPFHNFSIFIFSTLTSYKSSKKCHHMRSARWPPSKRQKYNKIAHFV